MESGESLARAAVFSLVVATIASVALVDFRGRRGVADHHVLILFVAAMFLVVAGFHALNRHRAWRRGRTVTAWAARRGFSSTSSTAETIDALAEFELFAEARGARARNLVRDEGMEPRGSFFELRHRTGIRDLARTRDESVAAFRFDGVRLPSFRLRPVGHRNGLGDRFDFGEIDFTHDPAFRERYGVTGEDAEAIDAALDAHVRSVLREQVPTWNAEARGPWLVLWKPYVPSRGLDGFVLDARAIARALGAAATREDDSRPGSEWGEAA
ncbi:MAG: hypothetical protein KC466_08285 [Myxococcales bacterium]|nr:hypothetical protein [Myxococcales bacterium]